MPISIEKTSRFLNCREWRSFVSAAQAAASNTSVVKALRSGQDWFRGQTWFSESPAKATEGLLMESGLVTNSRETLGI
jgi:hypothetical protein